MSENFLFYLIYPAIVAALSALASFGGSYYLQKKERKKDNEASRQDFIEKAIIIFESLSTILSKLSDDPIKFNYFSLQNIYSINPILLRLQNITDEKLSLFQQTEFRSGILNLIDETSSVINEIESMEKNPVNKFTEHQNTVKEKNTEFSTLKVKLLEMGVYLDDKNNPKSLEGKTHTENMLTQVKLIIQNLHSDMDNSQRQLDTIFLQAKDQRSFLAVKLLNIQSKIKDLISELKNKRLVA